ncbi:Uncharacterised protein [Peptostreptococcus anaerobius]|uniref:Uncharacterized protein n=1 Tax=Peptostreptococcus anaerobius TaxID=1261 RepID=A0A379CK30_9FIRM|nr:hypothetical protein [Peptostreptococcus anaerobius]SFN18112.1 hypothetical protein SAMN05660467_01517 [Peptostreptococcus anaerobius]SUB62106.1 Uncharacterised protein [Peptostreptococcus anaerobius]
MIRINKKYAITVDSLCFILNEVKKNKDGEEYLKQLTYHGTLRGLLTSIVKREIKVKNAKEFKDLEEKLCEIEDLIKRKKDINVSSLRKEYFEYKERIEKNGI